MTKSKLEPTLALLKTLQAAMEHDIAHCPCTYDTCYCGHLKLHLFTLDYIIRQMEAA